MRPLKNLAKSAVQHTRTYLYHKDRNQSARKILKTIEAERGKLNSKNRNLCKEYAKDILGGEKYAPWLFVYSAYAREFKEGWIPDNYYGEVVIPQINGLYGQMNDRSAVISTLLEVSNPLDICYYTNLLFLSTNYEVLNEEKLKKTLFAEYDRVVYKIENSQSGKGIYFFDKNSFDISIIKKLGNGVFQKYIEQHPFFSKFTNTSVATIRITSTCDDNGNIEAKAGYFRFGRENDTHVMSESALKIPIDLNTGKLLENVFFPNYQSTLKLPGNDFSYAGEVLPSFNDCIAEVKKMHSRIPYIRCIGWDIIVDNNDKVKLIELNGKHSAIRFSEMVQGPCFKGLNWENLRKPNNL